MKLFERVLIGALIGMMGLVLVISVVDLAWLIVKDLLSPPLVLLGVDELLDVFGLFLLVLIGLELFETLRVHHHSAERRAEVILLVAMIALARKVITLDIKVLPSGALLGLAGVLLALAIAFLAVRHARRTAPPEDE
jgi:uncharacterized membrane protein (DUF373 family)